MLLAVGDGSLALDMVRSFVSGGKLDGDTHIITTSEIDNYFNLQITTKLWFGSQQEPHDLILDTGSMVSSNCLIYVLIKSHPLFISCFIVDLGSDQGLLELWNTQQL